MMTSTWVFGTGYLQLCEGCGKVATGMAGVNNRRYCHGDEDSHPTCFEKASWKPVTLAAFDLGFDAGAAFERGKPPPT